MDGPARMRQAILVSALLAAMMPVSGAHAQSTISDRPFEVFVGNGLWASLLPSYELGTSSSGAPALRDNLDDVGYYGDIKAVRRFLGTRTSFEARGFYAFSESSASSAAADIDVPTPINGASNPFSGSTSRLDSDTDHYGYDVGLRDTWRTRFGGLSAGALFSYMAFDQTFDVDFASTRLLSEELNSDYIGGKALFGWDGCFCGRPTMLDVAVGFYQLRADYRFEGGAVPGSLATRMHRTPVTVEAIFSNYHNVGAYQLGFTFAATYLSEMPVIEHNDGAMVSLDTDDGAMLRMMLEILL